MRALVDVEDVALLHLIAWTSPLRSQNRPKPIFPTFRPDSAHAPVGRRCVERLYACSLSAKAVSFGIAARAPPPPLQDWLAGDIADHTWRLRQPLHFGAASRPSRNYVGLCLLACITSRSGAQFPATLFGLVVYRHYRGCAGHATWQGAETPTDNWRHPTCGLASTRPARCSL